MKQITIIGGGLAGLVTSILLARKDFEVTLHEKKQYPFHRVCGEYISDEVKPFLKSNGLFPSHCFPSELKTFQFTSVKGRSFELPLDMGGFGISRYALDLFLYEKARSVGVNIQTKTSINEVSYEGGYFQVTTNKESFRSQVVIGAYGKSGILDKKLNRSFIHQKAPFIGVKYHIKTDFPKDKIALHNFRSGYCGISAIEDEKYNLCYLGSRDTLRKYGSIAAMEEAVVKKNPHLNHIFNNSEFLFEKPEVINSFSFAPKKAVERHVLMSGDAAGLITPLCGNGMAMAIHSGKILSDCIAEHWVNGNLDRKTLELDYTKRWNDAFNRRLRIGRLTQRLFGSSTTSEFAVWLMKNSRTFTYQVMKNTHGQPF